MEGKEVHQIQTSNKVVAKSLFWKFMERCGAQLSSFIVSIILARILSPDDYGVLSILLVFIAIAQVFVQSGLSMALVQKKEIDNMDLSAVFYVSVAMTTIIYVALYFTAPFFSDFFKMKELTSTLRVISLSLFLGAIASVLNSILVRKMAFGKLFTANIIASIASGVIGLIMALQGFGVWALIWQYVSNQFFAVLFMELFCRWLPCGFSCVSRIKPLFNYGYKILIGNLVSTTYNELRSVAIGKKYNSAILAYYDKGKQFPHLIISNLDTTINNVMFPVYSSSKDNPLRVKQLLRRSMQISSYLLFPLMFGMCVIASSLVTVLLTDKWLACVPFLIVNALTYLLSPLQTANAQVINAIGRSDITMKLEIIKKSIGVVVLILSLILFEDVIYVAYGGLIMAVLSSVINMIPNKKLIGYSIKQQIVDILPGLCLSIVMALIVNLAIYLIDNVYILLCVQILTGIIVYIILSVITKNKSFYFIISLISKRLRRN